MKNQKIPLYTKKTLEFNARGWDGLLKPLNDFYQSSHLYYFLFTHQIKEKFGSLRVSVGPYNFYNDLIKNKAINELGEIKIDLDFFNNFGEYEKTYYGLSPDFSSKSMGQEIISNIKPQEIQFFLKQELLFHRNNNSNEGYEGLVKEIFSNSLNELMQSGEYIRDFGYLKQKLSSFAELSELMSSNTCMDCSNLGTIKAHNAQSNYVSCKCSNCALLSLSDNEKKNTGSGSINQFSVYDFEVSTAFRFYQQHTQISDIILNTPIEKMKELLIESDFIKNNTTLMKNDYFSRKYLTELLNFIEFKQKHLNSNKKINPFIVLSFFSLELILLGAVQANANAPEKFLQTWERLNIASKVDSALLKALKDYEKLPIEQSMFMKEKSRAELEKLILFIQACEQKENLNNSINEVFALPMTKNKI